MNLTKEDLTRLNELLKTLKMVQGLEEALAELLENMCVFPNSGFSEASIHQLTSLISLAEELRQAIESTISKAGSDLIN